MSISGSILHGITPKFLFYILIMSLHLSQLLVRSLDWYRSRYTIPFPSPCRFFCFLIFASMLVLFYFLFLLTFPVFFFQIERFLVSTNTSYTAGVIEKIDVEVDAISWDHASCQSWSLCLDRSLYMLHNRYNLIYPDLSHWYLGIRYVPRTEESVQL